MKDGVVSVTRIMGSGDSPPTPPPGVVVAGGGGRTSAGPRLFREVSGRAAGRSFEAAAPGELNSVGSLSHRPPTLARRPRHPARSPHFRPTTPAPRHHHPRVTPREYPRQYSRGEKMGERMRGEDAKRKCNGSREKTERAFRRGGGREALTLTVTLTLAQREERGKVVEEREGKQRKEKGGGKGAGWAGPACITSCLSWQLS